MSEDNAYLIKKITSHESDLVRTYVDVYPVLKEANPAKLPDEVAASLRRLDPPEIIEPSKAVAILKAIKGSTGKDKFALEDCYSFLMPSGQTIGSFIGDSLQKFGIAYQDFGPYLRDRGWLNE